MSTKQAPRSRSGKSPREPVAKPSRKTKQTTPSGLYHRRPEDMALETWQRELRRQYEPPVPFEVEKLDGHPVFCDYIVRNPETKRSYKVAIRDKAAGLNYCDCLDFKTNRLGTCKHIEFVMRAIERKRGNKKLLSLGYTPPYSSVFLEYGAERRVRLRIGTERSADFARAARDFFDEALCLRPEAYASFDDFLRRAARIGEDFRCYDDALELVIERRESERRREMLDKRYATPDSLEGVLKTSLYPYQRKGILFAARAGRCLIADEMGLGKTIQALGAAELLRRETRIARVLIVCPTSLKYQWQSEIRKFAGTSTLVVEGGPLAREKQYEEEAFYKIVSYHAASRDLEAIGRMEPDLVILDEAQRIKNWRTKIARAVKQIRSPYAIVLTGTPLENNLEELYSIVEFVDPFRLGPFYKFLDAHQVKDDTGKVTGYRGLHEIGSALGDITIRRRKKEVLAQLPERIEKRVFVPLGPKQRGIHEENELTVTRLVQKWRRQGFLMEQDRQRLLLAMSIMRMVCDSTFILDQDANGREDTKIDELMSILDECLADPGQKVVVFSQWERMTRLVAAELDARGIGYRSLHGGVPSSDRKELFDGFNGDPGCRVFLSTDAGSTGLNLQAASIVVNLDLPWNPAVLEQRIARVHRIGQKRPVFVVNIIAADSIESRMLGLLAFKAELAAGILDAGDDAIFMTDERHGRFMNMVAELTGTADEREGIALGGEPRPAIKREEAAEATEAAELASTDESERPREEPDGEPDELVARGLSFFSELARPGAAERLVAQLTYTDPQDGRSYLKIPVADAKDAAQALGALAALFSTLPHGKR